MMKEMTHVLLIERDVSTARLMAWILAEAGYETEVERDPSGALAHARRWRPDVIVINGEMQPAETARWIASMHAQVPAAHFVDMVRASDRRGHPAAGAEAVLVAPFDAEQLIESVREAAGDEAG